MLKLVHHVDTTGRAEGVPGRFGRELVDAEVVAAAERDVFFGWVEPEVGVLLVSPVRDGAVLPIHAMLRWLGKR